MITTFVLALVSIAVVPSIVGMRATSDRRETMANIRRLAATARERAISSGQTTQVIYDDSLKQFQIQDVASDGTATTASTIQLLASIEPTRFQLADKDSSSSDFKLTFTPDGKSNGGGVEFSNFAITVGTNGLSKFITGTLPDPTDQVWQAGNLEQRATQ